MRPQFATSPAWRRLPVDRPRPSPRTASTSVGWNGRQGPSLPTGTPRSVRDFGRRCASDRGEACRPAPLAYMPGAIPSANPRSAFLRPTWNTSGITRPRRRSISVVISLRSRSNASSSEQGGDRARPPLAPTSSGRLRASRPGDRMDRRPSHEIRVRPSSPGRVDERSGSRRSSATVGPPRRPRKASRS